MFTRNDLFIMFIVCVLMFFLVVVIEDQKATTLKTPRWTEGYVFRLIEVIILVLPGFMIGYLYNPGSTSLEHDFFSGGVVVEIRSKDSGPGHYDRAFVEVVVEGNWTVEVAISGDWDTTHISCSEYYNSTGSYQIDLDGKESTTWVQVKDDFGHKERWSP